MEQHRLNDIAAWFDRYSATFRVQSSAEQRNYDLKVEHTHLVRDLIERLTASLELGPEDRALAAAIAIGHDVGRFPQYRDYGTFNDATSTNHAALSVQTLKGEGILDGLDDARRSILLQAVALHNVFMLPEGLDPVARRFACLSRDADKLDIWRILIEYCSARPEARASAVRLELPDTGTCSVGALKEVVCGRMPNRSLLTTADDLKLLQLSWVFDLNLDEAFKIMDERGYIETLAQLLPDQPGCREAVATVQGFVRSRLKRN